MGDVEGHAAGRAGRHDHSDKSGDKPWADCFSLSFKQTSALSCRGATHSIRYVELRCRLWVILDRFSGDGLLVDVRFTPKVPKPGPPSRRHALRQALQTISHSSSLHQSVLWPRASELTA